MSCCHCTTAPPLDNTQALPSAEAEKKQMVWRVVRLVSAAFIAGNSMLFTLTFNLSMMEPATRHWFLIGLLLSVVLVFSLLAPPFISGLKSAWKRRRPGVEGLFLLGMAGAIGVSLNSVRTGSGPVYFEVVNILLVIYSFGAMMKAATQQRVALAGQSRLAGLSSCIVETESGECFRIPVSQVQTKNRIRLAVGDIVPVDGTIVEGEAFVSESGMTGEPYAQPKYKGDFLYATSLVVDAPLVVEASRPGNVREIDLIRQVIDKIKQTPSQWQSLAERIASWFSPFVCCIAIATFALWMISDSVSAGLFTGLAVLLVACPCAFGFATPIAVWQANSIMFERAIAPQRGDLVERLAEIDTVVFDKTGTLTVVQPMLSGIDVRLDCNWSREELLEIAAAVESQSCHPIAAAFHREGMNRFTCESFTLIPAIGVQAVVTCDKTRYDVFLGRAQNQSDNIQDQHRPWYRSLPAADETAVFVLMMCIDGEITARFQVAETAFDSVPSGLASLKKSGVQTVVLSGDSSPRVHAVAADLTIGAMTAKDKADYVRQLKQDGGHVLYVGDGMNDALAMTESDIAVAVSQGSSMLHETADAVWYGDDLRVFAQLIDASRQMTSRLRTTLKFAIVYNTIGMIVAASGYLHPVFAAVLMLGSSLFVVIRSVETGSTTSIQIPRDKNTLLQSSPRTPVPETLVQLSLK